MFKVGRSLQGSLVLLTVLSLLAGGVSRAQSINTYAGGGPVGDGRIATEATLSFPTGIAVAPNGDIYISDERNNLVRRVDGVTGIISTVAGGGNNGPLDNVPGTATQLLIPSGLAVDDDGNLFVADTLHFRICRVDTKTGILTTVGGGGERHDDGIPATEAYAYPVGMEMNGGDLYYADPDLHKVRRIDLDTGIVTTVAGDGQRGFGGDGGPATEAQLDRPYDIAFDGEDLYIIGTRWGKTRWVDAETGIIDEIVFELAGRVYGIAARDRALYLSSNARHVVAFELDTMSERFLAGTGDRSFYGDGGPAEKAALAWPHLLDFDQLGRLYIADGGNNRIRRVDGVDGQDLIHTIAGGGSVGDGGPATAAVLSVARAIDLTPAGELVIGSLFGYRLRSVDPETRVISTIAGDGISEYTGEGGPATAARIADVYSIEIDSEGDIYIGTGSGMVRRIDATTGTITRVAGTGHEFSYGGDGGPATETPIYPPFGLAVDSEGNLFLSDSSADAIRRVDAGTGIITTIAGRDGPGYSGDGGPSSEAQLDHPWGLALDRDENLYIGDANNQRVRRIDRETGIITTFAGKGEREWSGDGGPATEAGIPDPIGLAFDGVGNLYIVEGFAFSARIRRVDAQTGIITTVAGTESGDDYRGDGGPATEASLSAAIAIAVDSAGNIFESEQASNRVRSIFACSGVDSPGLTAPENGATGQSTGPSLAWSPAEGAFSYDVVLDSNPSPSTVVATDLTTTSFSPSNLDPGVTYYWRVLANGDPFCASGLSVPSEIRSFSTVQACQAPEVVSLLTPADGFALMDTSITLSWTAAARASHYDVHLGTTDPPPMIRSTSATKLPVAGLVEGNTYYWSIVAHASCDATRTSRSEMRSFDVVGGCAPAGAFSLTAPSDGVVDTTTTLSLEWSSSANASSYDFFLGTTNPPPIFLPDIQDTRLRISGLMSNRRYYWQVKANIDCDETKSLTSEVASFTTIDDCVVPEGATITFTPPGDVGIGQTYAITWREARGLDSGGTYLVERSLDPSFAALYDSQEVSTTSATFLASSIGTHYHRVRPVMGCNPGVIGPASATASVKIVEEKPNIIFTVEPEAVVGTPGLALEDLRTKFTIENIASSPVQVVIAQALIESVPFFTITDPLGGDAVFATLAPREPKTYEIRFSGPPNDVEAAYQGLIALSVANSPIIPYAFVNLKVGDQGTATPEFRISGTPSEYTFFPGHDGEDSNRPPITVEIHNAGTTPMELGAEIGPEIWLEPDAKWNDTPIPAGGTRSVTLSTRRTRALNGSALPRYTWFGVRTKSGKTARILVQDNGAASVGQGRTSALEPGEHSFIVPEVVSETSLSGTTLISQVRLSNLGSDLVQAELFFTPTGSDGFGASVQSATLVVPPNDVATLTDPLVQIFEVSRPASGQLEVRAAESKIGLLKVETSIVSGDRADSSFVRVPTIRRGDGARVGLGHQIAGITATASAPTSLVLAETSGTDEAEVTVQLFDSSGTSLGQASYTVPRYGHLRIDRLVPTLGGSVPLVAGRLTIQVTDGGGSIVALGKIEDQSREYASVLLSSPAPDSVNAKHARNAIGRRGPFNGATAALAAPYVASGTVDAESDVEYSTLMGFVAPFLVPLDFLVTFTDSSGQSLQQTVSVLAGSIVEFQNVLEGLFGISGSVTGSIVVTSDPRGRVYARLVAGGSPAGALDLASPVSELVTMVDSARPLYVDGLEQSTDPERGARWNLYVREIAGEIGTITVRLYEAGNRTHPIAVKQLAVGADSQIALETVFDALDLNSDNRRKDRTNVLCVVTPDSGDAVVTAAALEIDNRTGAATSHTLQPASGLPASGGVPTLVRVVEPETTRRRPVRRD